MSSGIAPLGVEDDVLGAFTEERRRAQEQRLVLERRAMRRRQLERRRRRARIRRNRFIAVALLCALFSVIGLALSRGGQSNNIQRHFPRAFVTSKLTRSLLVVPGKLASMPWPKDGQGALATSGGLIASSPNEHVVPIASLTKMMTAYLILADHPLGAISPGPSLRMTAADVAQYVTASQTDESNAPVALGEKLSERQLLEALMLPSADNIANTLGIWDSGNLVSFVAKMNTEAKVLGLSHTHYADTSGVNPLSRSTASDQAVLAALLMQNPAIDTIVDQGSVPFPVAGHLWAVNPALGVDGINGIKSGYTSKAMGCLATSAYKSTGNQKVLTVAVTLGQPDGLYGATHVDEGLLNTMNKSFVLVQPVSNKTVVGTYTENGAITPLVVNGPAPSFVGWPGMHIAQQVLPVSNPRPDDLASLAFSTSTGTLGSAQLVAKTSVVTNS